MVKILKEDKIIDITINLVVLIIAAIAVYYYMNSDKFSEERRIKRCKEYKELSFSGVVLRTYDDMDNKRYFTAEIKTEKDTIKQWEWKVLAMWKYLHDNDSIIKVKNSYDYKIFKNGNKDSLVYLKGTPCNLIEKE